jgi:uncharacterized protein (DUF1800 family)
MFWNKANFLNAASQADSMMYKVRRRLIGAALAIAAMAFGGIATAQTSQANQVGFWWKSTEPGWGLSIQQQGTSNFAIWYTYNAQGSPVWYTLVCTQSGSTCAGNIVTATGTPFNQITASANQTAQTVGTGSLTFAGNDTITLTSTINGVSQTKSNLERFNLVPTAQAPTCTLQAGSRASASNFTDLWWGGASASGWGLQITHQAGKVFLGWYSYGENREAIWTTGEGARDPANANRLTGNLYQFPKGTPYTQTSSTPPAAKQVGTFELFFTSGDAGTFSYTLPGLLTGSRALAIRRFADAAGNTNLCSDPAVLSPVAKSASRFLQQASFGPNRTDLARVQAIGDAAWIEEQFTKSQTLYLPPTAAYLATLPVDQQRGQTGFTWALWKNMVTADDQLRQRIAFAMSQITVISLETNQIAFGQTRGPAHYYDQLGKLAFGNYRDWLEEVSLSPMMGIYLSSIRNQKENPTTGAMPDENYAREVMQLFSIGLYELNNDGTLKLNAQGQPIETYTNADITGLAKVFTGLSWAGPDTSNTRFGRGNGVAVGIDDPDREIKRMQMYPQYHSTSEKKFLGVTIPAQATATVASANNDLRIALDRLFNHPNVGPFIGTQFIQRLVKSNPSPAYVSRVASAFNNNGAGVRGDMKALIRAVLLDPEARNADVTANSGKLREPVVRFVQWMRAYNAKSTDGRFLLGATTNGATTLGQSPMRSPTVFNFFRPGYLPPNTATGAAGLVSPEMQITNESSIAGYLNYMRGNISTGVGTTGANGLRDVQPDYAQELSMVDNPTKLLDEVDLMLTGGSLTATTRGKILEALNSIAITTDAGRRNRVHAAIFLTMASPEYINLN